MDYLLIEKADGVVEPHRVDSTIFIPENCAISAADLQSLIPEIALEDRIVATRTGCSGKIRTQLLDATTPSWSCFSQSKNALPENPIELITTDFEIPVAGFSFYWKDIPRPDTKAAHSIPVLFLALYAAHLNGSILFQCASDADGKGTRYSLPPEQKSTLLHCLIAECTIESLFSQYNWQQLPQESAATSYHDLAALFLSSNDPESALECIHLSEHFMDSPRSLALKGIIAKQKGDTLTAVANMVSSLQCYESIEKDTIIGFHRLSVDKYDTECLETGLKALNSKDNVKAFSQFSKSVRSCDSFFNYYNLLKE